MIKKIKKTETTRRKFISGFGLLSAGIILRPLSLFSQEESQISANGLDILILNSFATMSLNRSSWKLIESGIWPAPLHRFITSSTQSKQPKQVFLAPTTCWAWQDGLALASCWQARAKFTEIQKFTHNRKAIEAASTRSEFAVVTTRASALPKPFVSTTSACTARRFG